MSQRPNPVPRTRYVRSAGCMIAYQVYGEGPPDMILFKSSHSHLDLQWTEPRIAALLNGLASFGRVIDFDPRGGGLSDRLEPGNHPSWEEWADDALAVLDAAGCERVTPIFIGSGGLRGLLFAASHPERLDAVVLLDVVAHLGGPAVPDHDERFAALESDYPDFFVRRDEPPSFVAWQERFHRAALSPGSARTLVENAVSVDHRTLMATIHTPALQIFHERLAQTWYAEVSESARRYSPPLEHARVVDLPGTAHLGGFVLDDPEAVTAEIQSFLTGKRPLVDTDRVLATVLFTDVVDSTAQTVREGDAAWRSTLDRLDEIVAGEVARFRGRLIKHTGDGHLATFDGPGRAITCAGSIGDAAADVLGLRLRAGLHIGEVVRRGDDITGIAVVIGRRVCDMASAGEVLVTEAVRPLVAGSGLRFADHGRHELKGVPDEWQLHRVLPEAPDRPWVGI